MDLIPISKCKGYTFVIPYQQRGYRWTQDNVETLLEDFNSFLESEKKMYCLQPITVVKVEGEENSYRVVDGQQRLTTLFLIWKFLGQQPYNFEFERDDKMNKSETFLNKIFLNKIEIAKETEEEAEEEIDKYYIYRAYKTINEWFESHNSKKEQFLKLFDKEDGKSIGILWHIVNAVKEHQVFRNINSGKIQLGNSDLIKALLLNKTANLENRQQIAAQFELMERQLSEDHFWYMLRKEDIKPLKGQSRIDLIFNMVANIKQEDYQVEPRKSFYEFSKSEDLHSKWKEAREKFQRLRDLFDDPVTFHYVGFLIYCGQSLDDIVKEYAKCTKKNFVEHLKELIKKKLKHRSLDDYSFYDDKRELRKLFILHNIETLLFRYKELKDSKSLRTTFENFPFELLYKQSWNIEHIASHTDNSLKNENDRSDWLKSVVADFKTTISEDVELENLKNEAESDLNNDDKFMAFYNKVLEKVNDNPIKEEDKDRIGNLVLLDEHTNKSFHNSLFPRKRRIVIMASGLRNKNDSENVESVYVPICTQQVYTKSYNKQSNVNLNCWGQDDYNSYVEDIREKLQFYLKKD